MRRFLIACAMMTLVGLVLLIYVFWGDLNPLERKLVGKHGNAPFTRATWTQADPAGRGAALSDLFSKYRFEGMYGEDIDEILGAKDCYVLYDDEPCYVVSLGGTTYYLQFSLNHSSDPGRVLGVKLKQRGV